jgi:hypothetical protein
MFLIACALATSSSAQLRPSLVITEVMSKATMNQYPAFRGTDFWELTNFGTNAFDLTGYSFSDANTNQRIFGVLSNLIIQPSESIVFVNLEPSTVNTCLFTNEYQYVPNAMAFVQWWGAANLPANLQVCTYRGSRFDGLGDQVYLFDASGIIVDSVSVGVATPGRSFAYDPTTGKFGKISSPGEAGTFKADLSDDYGSPGSVPKPLPLQILQQPASQTIDMEMETTLSVVAGGMPPPCYQWIHQGTPLTNATAASLSITNAQPGDAGDYQVYISNGATQLFSAVATLTVNTNPYVKILQPPSNLAAYEGQSALFSVSAKGIPAPSFQWQANGVDIPGETDSLLVAYNCTPEMAGTVYSVRVWNQYGATNASAKLTVSSRPRLAITEVMSLASFGHADWFEVTNYGTNEVDLLGYRIFDRETIEPGFANFFDQPKLVKITNSIVLRPGESVIFLHHLSADDFTRWWGKENLPPGLQIYTYSGFTLSVCGETVYLWNAAATAVGDTVATTSWKASSNFHSWVCSDNEFTANGYIGDGDIASILGVAGAWAAPQGSDIGSPGLTEVTPPHFLGISRNANEVVLKCRGTTGKTIRLSLKGTLGNGVWMPICNTAATNALPFLLRDPAAGNDPTRFYRLEAIP